MAEKSVTGRPVGQSLMVGKVDVWPLVNVAILGPFMMIDSGRAKNRFFRYGLMIAGGAVILANLPAAARAVSEIHQALLAAKTARIPVPPRSPLPDVVEGEIISRADSD